MLNLSLGELLSRFSTSKISTELEEKLDENMPLEEYLKNEEAFQCYKDMNKNAQKYFDKSKIKKLIEYITVEPENDEYFRGHKYPYVASEILKTYVERIHDLFVMNDDEYKEKHNKKEEEVNEDDINTKDTLIDDLEKTPITIVNLDKDKSEVKEDKKLENIDNNDENANIISKNKEKEEKVEKEEKEEDKKINNNNDKESEKDEKETKKVKETEKEKENEVNKIENKEETKENNEEIKKEDENDNKKDLKEKEEKAKKEEKEEKEVKEEEEKKDEKEKTEDNKNEKNDNEKKDDKNPNENEKSNNNKDIKENENDKKDNNNKLEEKKEIEKEENKKDSINNKDNNIISDEKENQNNNEIKEEGEKGKTIDNSHNELLDLLLDFVITDKIELNDILCGYFSNTLLTLIDHYPTKLLLYLYMTRKDALRKIVLLSYQKSLSSVALKLLNVENFLSLILAEFKKGPSKYNKEDLIKNVENCCFYRNELIEEMILSMTLDGYKDHKGNINKNIDLKSIFSLLNELIKEKSILTNIVYKSNIYNHIYTNLTQKEIYLKNEINKDKNKQSIYLYFIILITNIIATINKSKEGFSFLDNLIEIKSAPTVSEKAKNGNFAERLIYILCSLILYSYTDVLSVSGTGVKKQKLGIHNIHIMELIIECFNFYKAIPKIFDDFLINSQFMKKSIDFYFTYQLNNIYQYKFNHLISLLLDNESEHYTLSEHLFNELKFHETLIDYVNQGENDNNKNKNEIKLSTEISSDNKKDISNLGEEGQKDIINDNKKQRYKNRFYYASGRETKSCGYTYIIELIYKIHAKSGLKVFDEEEQKKLNIKNIGYFEFVKDENSNNNILEVKNSQRLNDILKLSTIWTNTFENQVLPLIRKYETKLCSGAPVAIKTISPQVQTLTPSTMSGLLMNLYKLISKKDKILNKIGNKNNNDNNNKESVENKESIDNKDKNKDYNDVNYWGVNSSISPELRDKINQNQTQKINDKNNSVDKSEEKKEKTEENPKNEQKKDDDNEELELLGLAMEMEKKEKKTKSDPPKLANLYMKKGNIVLKLDDLNQNPNNDKNDKLNSSSNSNNDSNNDKPSISNDSNLLSNKEKNSTKTEENNQMDKNEEEKNSKYNDTNFWQTNTESLVNEKEMQNLIDDL